MGLSPRLTLLAGCSTYVLCIGSFLYYNHYQQQLFAIIVSAILGVGVGLLWARQVAIMAPYPLAGCKGTYISIFWSIFNMTGVIGGLIPFSLNYNRTTAASVNDDTYISFMVFMSIGIVLSLTILPPRQVICNDGSRATNVRYLSVGTESMEILKLFTNWKMLLTVPASWASKQLLLQENKNGVGFDFMGFESIENSLFLNRTKVLRPLDFYSGGSSTKRRG